MGTLNLYKKKQKKNFLLEKLNLKKEKVNLENFHYLSLTHTFLLYMLLSIKLILCIVTKKQLAYNINF